MIPVLFERATRVLQPAEGSTDGPLPICDGQMDGGGHVMISCWRLSDAEAAEVARTGVVWLMLAGEAHPSAVVMARPPFDAPPAESEAEQNARQEASWQAECFTLRAAFRAVDARCLQAETARDLLHAKLRSASERIVEWQGEVERLQAVVADYDRLVSGLVSAYLARQKAPGKTITLPGSPVDVAPLIDAMTPKQEGA